MKAVEERWGKFKNSISMSNLGCSYKYGEGLERNIEMSFYYFNKSAELDCGIFKLSFFILFFIFLFIFNFCIFYLFFFKKGYALGVKKIDFSWR